MHGFILTGGYYLPVYRMGRIRYDEDNNEIDVFKYQKRGLYFDELPDEQHTESD